MPEWLIDVVNWIEGLPPLWVYLTVFVVSYLENVIPPIPGDMLIVFVGYLVGLGAVGFLPVVVLATLGGAAGFMTMYAVGWRFGAAVFDTQRMLWIPKRPAWRAREWLHRYGYVVVAVNRFLSGLRSVISLAVGAARMHVVPTAAWATVSSAAWCALIVYGGYLVGERWEVIADYLDLYGRAVMTVAILTLALYVAYRAWRAWRAPRAG